METGRCKAAFKMFYFNGKECTPFTYGGCDGNANRFDTLGSCVATCGK